VCEHISLGCASSTTVRCPYNELEVTLHRLIIYDVRPMFKAHVEFFVKIGDNRLKSKSALEPISNQ